LGSKVWLSLKSPPRREPQLHQRNLSLRLELRRQVVEEEEAQELLLVEARGPLLVDPAAEEPRKLGN